VAARVGHDQPLSVRRKRDVGGLAKPRCRAYAVCGARRAAPRQCPALRARGSQRILNQPDAAVLRVRHGKQRAVWRKVQPERAMKAAGYPVSESRARPPCAAHGRRVARRGADDADLVVARVRDSHLRAVAGEGHACGPPEEGARAVARPCTWEAAARVQRQRARQRGGAPVLPRRAQRRGRGRERAPGHQGRGRGEGEES